MFNKLSFFFLFNENLKFKLQLSLKESKELKIIITSKYYNLILYLPIYFIHILDK